MQNFASPTVFHVIPTLLTGGAEGMLESLLSAPREESYRQVVINLTGEGSLTRRVPSNISVYNLELGGIAGVPKTVRQLSKLIREHRPRSVQSWLYYADLISLAALEFSGCRSTTKLYWGVRASHLDLSQYRRSLSWTISLCAFFSGRPDAVVANSAAGRDAHIALGYKPRAFPVISNGIDLQRFHASEASRLRIREALAIGKDEILVIHVARVDPMKDQNTFLEIARKRPALRFLLVGPDTETLTLPSNAIALGTRRDMPDLYAAADIAVSTSAFGEGFPNAVAEAMACGVPVVATNVGDSSPIVGTSGYVVNPGDRSAMLACIDQLVALPASHRRSMGASGRARIESRFSIERSVALFDRLLLRGEMEDEGSGRYSPHQFAPTAARSDRPTEGRA
ncbi:MAG TPA: glycosyltransferase [Xanthobacteraceae bacterium]|jgi:glycosyltransferase involved in cell wall biosynthesis